MIKALKIIKRIFIGIICIPFVLIILFTVYEFVGIAVNNYSAGRQTKNLIDNIENIESVEILDSYTYCGSTGNGNHVDMLSLVLVRTEYEPDEISCYIQSDEDYSIVSCENIAEYDSRFYNQLEYPENKGNCYIIKIFNSAPFVDNIMGH